MHRFTIGVFAALATWATTAAAHTVHAPIARNLVDGICPRGADWVNDVEGELAGKLSPTAKIYLPGSDEFDAASARWSALEAPKVNVVVVAGIPDDVAVTVSFSSLSDSF